MTAPVLEDLRREGQKLLPDIKMSDLSATSRQQAEAHIAGRGRHGDFIIEEAKGVSGFINLVGIESPGLTSAPRWEMVRDIVAKHIPLAERAVCRRTAGLRGHFCDSAGRTGTL
ncbi:MAG: hypothetical protein ACLUEQ_02370 [Cloacibacillus evryensis]